MKILNIVDYPTHPPLAGNQASTIAYSGLLAELGHEVHLLCSHRGWDRSFSERHLEATRSAWGDRFHLHRQTPVDRLLQVWAHKVRFRLSGGYPLDSLCPVGLPATAAGICARGGFDAAIVNYWHLTAVCRKLPPKVRTVLFTHDRFSDKLARMGGSWLSTTRDVERRALDRVDVALAVQDDETRFFQELSRTPVLTSFTHFPLHDLPFTGRRRLLFLGGPNVPNTNSLRFFVREAWPLIHQADPGMELLVGGRICRVVPEMASVAGVVLHGDVERLEDFYGLGDVCVNPTDTGTGLKIKTFEALGHGRAMICHPHSAEGIFRPQTAPLTYARTGPEYRDAVLELFGHPDRLRQTCQDSIRYIQELNRFVGEQFQKALTAES